MDKLSFSVQEAQQVCGIGKTKMYEIINSGQLPARKLGRKTIILKKDLEDFLDKLETYLKETC